MAELVVITHAQAPARRQRHVTPSGTLTHVSTNRMEQLALGRREPAGFSGPTAYLV